MSKKIIFYPLLASLLFLSSCNSPSPSETEKSWEIGKNVASEMKAEVVGSTLKITGRGEMQDFSKASETPWYSVRKDIKAVDIEEGITSLGEKSLICLGVEKIVIPSSITNIARDAIFDETLIYLKNNDLELDLYFEPYVYYYSENAPETNDVFWQSDFEKVDITTYLKEDDKLYWHDVEGEVVNWEKQKVLFIGNSFTYRNGVIDHSSGVPGIFDDIASDMGLYVETYSITGPGWYLDAHASKTDTCGKQVDLLLNAVSDFDHVVLQEQSVNPFENYNRFLNGATLLRNKIDATQDHAQVHLYETWGSPYSANERKITINEMEAKLRKAYKDAGEALNVDVTYVGRAFSDVYTHHPDIYLWASDNRHQGYTGAYLSAATHVCKMLDVDVRETHFVNNAKYSAPVLSEEVLTVLKQGAYDSAHDIIHDDDPIIDPVKEYDLEIGVWGRWITEAQFKDLYDAFIEDCDAKSINHDKFHYTYYQGATTSDPYYYIANFSGLAKQNMSDIIFPCANNLNTQDGSAYLNEEITITALNITLNGSTNRCVAKINDEDNTNLFYNFVLTDEGKTILDPTYVPAN